MTDKQIIIDISKCEHYEDFNCFAYRDSCGYPLDCKDNPNCYYKQLKLKEQECEKLKLEINSYVIITDECLRIDNKRLADEKRDLQQQLDQLKAELEQEKNQHSILKKMFADIDKANTGLHNKLNQLKAENEELKEQFKLAEPLYQSCNIKDKKINKLKQTLTEIKEIAEKTYKTPLVEKDCIDCDGYLHQILQKISEVTNE